MASVIELLKLPADQIPPQFKVERYFDLKAHPFKHEAFFKDPRVTNVVGAVRAIGAYVTKWLAENLPKLEAERKAKILTDAVPNGAPASGHFRIAIEPGATFLPSCIVGVAAGKPSFTLYVAAGASVAGDICLDKGGVYIGEGTTVERGATIKGPAIIGKKNEIRMGAYFRGDILIGDGGTFRGELKNVLVLDKGNFPHPGYVGDSLCGYMSHFGNQATAANLGIFEGVREPSKRKNLVMKVDGKQYDLGGPKLGIILGDFSQVGCNSVADPGTFLAPYTIVYQLTRLNRGFYGPNVLVKNKPMEHGVIEITSLQSLE
jgi:hypothetical protein